MTKREKINALLPTSDDLIFIDGFDCAIMGFCENTNAVIYSITKIIEHLISKGMSEDEAINFYQYEIPNFHKPNPRLILCNDGIQYFD